MRMTFAESLRSLREQRGLSQQQLAERLFVGRSTVARWESADRMPDLTLVPRIADALGTDAASLLDATSAGEVPQVIVVDDERAVLAGCVSVLEEALPGAEVTGFAKPSEALAFASSNRVAVAFLDVEMGRTSGLVLCRELLDINPRINVVYLTAYAEYALEAWATGACGYLLKPVTVEVVRKQLANLQHPVAGLTT